jgi:hypothetical protein
MADSNGNGGTFDEGFLRRYREMLDAETAAFDELEHSYEEGDRERFDRLFSEWQAALNRKRDFLVRRGIHLPLEFVGRVASPT